MSLNGSLMDGPNLQTAMVDTDIVLGEAISGELEGELSGVLERLAQAWRRHTAETEAGDGLLQEILDHAPRLGAEADRLRGEHQLLAEELRCLRLRLVTEYGPSPAIFEEIGALLTAMRLHDRAGGSLIWEAYTSEVTGGE